ncbi:unnamed protein product, partial [Ceratitis capitata]
MSVFVELFVRDFVTNCCLFGTIKLTGGERKRDIDMKKRVKDVIILGKFEEYTVQNQ